MGKSSLPTLMKQLLLFALFFSALFAAEAKLSTGHAQPGTVLMAKWKASGSVTGLTFAPIAPHLTWISSEETKPSGTDIYSIHCSNSRTGKKVWEFRLRNEG